MKYFRWKACNIYTSTKKEYVKFGVVVIGYNNHLRDKENNRY